MAIDNIAIRFTDEQYATKNEVIKELRTSLVDSFWSRITNYREQFKLDTNLINFDSHLFHLCNGALLKSKNEEIDTYLSRFVEKYDNLSNSNQISEFNTINRIASLSNIAKYHGDYRSEGSIRAILANKLSLESNADIINKYNNALEYASSHIVDDINHDYVFSLMKILCNDNIAYRSIELNNKNKVLIDRVYNSAPVKMIENMMNELFTFIANADLSPIIKSCIVYFYITLIQPFDQYNEELGLLLFKSVLAREFLNTLAFIPNFEDLLNIDKQHLIRINNETKKYSDLTYNVIAQLDVIKSICESALDRISVDIGSMMQEEQYQMEDEIEDKTNTYEEPLTAIDTVAISEQEIKLDLESPNVDSSESKDNEIKDDQPPRKEHEDNNDNEEDEIQPTYANIAINYVPPVIDEKEAKRIAEHLLETDPLIRKLEAKFYARHCVLGRSYTIQQFKKYNNCAYETARTGMDHLVELGYYRKEQVKNKFVYSPILRR